MNGEDLEEVMDTLREQALALEVQYEYGANDTTARWEADRPQLLDTIQALSQTRDLMRKEVKRRTELLAIGGGLAAQPIGAGVSTGFNVIQSRAGQDGAPLSTESLMAERDRLVDSLAHVDVQIDGARKDLQRLARSDEQELCESRLIILQDTRRMYQDEVDMMEIELLGRERAERLAAERAAAEANGRAELARLEATLLATEQKLDVAKKRLYFPAAKGYGMSFGSNGIYVGGKDTFISELSGPWNVRGAVYPQSITGAPGPVPRITVTLGFAAPPSASATIRSSSASSSQFRSSGSYKGATPRPSQGATSPADGSLLRPGSGLRNTTDSAVDLASVPSSSAPSIPPGGSGDWAPAATWAGRSQKLDSSDASSLQPPPPPQQQPEQGGSVRALKAAFESGGGASGGASSRASGGVGGGTLGGGTAGGGVLGDSGGRGSGGGHQPSGSLSSGGPPGSAPVQLHSSSSASRPSGAIAVGEEGATATAAAGRKSAGVSGQQPRATGPGAMGGSRAAPVMGLPPLDPRSKSKNMAMKLMNKIGNKQPNKKLHGGDAPKYPGESGSEGMQKGKSLANRLLSKKASRRTDKLTFGSNAQGSQRRHSSLPSFAADPSPSDTPYNYSSAQQPTAPPSVFQPAAAAAAAATSSTSAPSDVSNGRQGSGAISTEELDLEPPSARHSESDEVFAAVEGPGLEDAVVWPEDDPSSGGAAGFLSRSSTGADSWDAVSRSSQGGGGGGGTSDRGSDGMASTLAAGRRGMFAALRIEDLGVIGEKGTKVPNVTVAEINIELEFQMTFILEWDASSSAWGAPQKAKTEMLHLDRTVRGNNVPLPRTLLRFVLNATLPRIFQRRILRMLPLELGRYLLDAGRGFSTHGEIGLVGPALSALDAHIGFAMGSATRAKDAKHAAQHAAAAQEARSMLGLSFEQASALAALFGGQHSLLAHPRRACIADLIAFLHHRSASSHLWPQLCTVWDAALRAVCQARGVQNMPSFVHLMRISVGGLARKPVRARFQMNKLELALNIDAAMGAARDYFERVMREVHAKAPGSTPHSARDVEAQQSLEVQLAALQTWETYIFGRLKTFKNRFRKLTLTAVGGADAEKFSIGAEDVSYEGPMQLRLQVPTPIVEGDGAFSFHIPLPNPKGPIRAFLDRVRTVLTMPLPPYFAPHLNSLVSGGAEAGQVEGEKSVLEALQDLGNHFGDRANISAAADAVDEAVAETAAPDEGAPDPPRQRIGKMIVNRMRVRALLNERRLGELLRGMDPASLGDSWVSVTTGLLACIGDIASLNFMPVFDSTEDGGSGRGQYLVCLESSDVSNISADLAALGFQSALNPGRMIRVLHTLVRTVLITLRPQEEEKLAIVDRLFENVYHYTVRDALDVSLAMSANGRIEDNPNVVGLAQMFVHLGNLRGDDGDVSPLSLTNDVDLVTLYRALSAPPEPT